MDSLKRVNAKTIAAYDRAADRYLELFRDELESKDYDRALLDGFADALGHGARVCDAGCGPCGHVARYLAERGLRVVGVDLSPRCVELARQRHADLEFAVGDIGEMDFADASLDGLVAYYSIINTPQQHLPRLFREFHRVLKPGGALFVAVKAGDSEGYLAELLDIRAESWFTLFHEDEIARLCAEAGFALELLERRNPYDFEIDNERIYALGRKAGPAAPGR